MGETKTKQKRQLKGVVVSDKMQKTIVVEVKRLKFHSKYRKSYWVLKKFKAHSNKNEYHVGDKVIIEATRPLSKDKRWRVIDRA
jgi:small subunit ribosomal protein S17